MTTANTKSSNIKTAVVVTYVIATLLLIAGWFVPAFGYGEDLEIADMMLFWYVPAIVNAFLNPFLGEALITGDFVKQHPLPGFTAFESQIIPDVDLHIPALMMLVYLVLTVLAIIFLIPVIAGKKEKKTSITCAYIIEGAALAALGILFVFSAWETNLRSTAEGYLNLICVFSAVLVVLFVQCIIEKKSYGAAKVFLFLFSAAAFMFAMFAIDNLIVLVLEKLGAESAWTDALDAIQAESGLYAAGGVAVGGFTALKTLIDGLMRGENLIWVEDYSVTMNIVNVCVLALFAVLAINLIIDFCGLMAGNKTDKNGVLIPHKGGKIFGLVRYLIALAVIACLIVCVFVDEDLDIGVCAYFAALFVLINVIIDIVRLARVPAQKKKAQSQDDGRMQLASEGITDKDEEQTDLISDELPAQPYAPAYAEPVAETAEEPAAEEQSEEVPEIAPVLLPETEPEEEQPEEELPAEEPEKQPEEKQEEPYVYTPRPVIYNGPTDAFLDTLSTEEKVEFSKVFIDKSKGKLPARMPEYEIGGDNEDFFPAIFINLGRFRALLSSGLLRKIYKYLNSK